MIAANLGSLRPIPSSCEYVKADAVVYSSNYGYGKTNNCICGNLLLPDKRIYYSNQKTKSTSKI